MFQPARTVWRDHETEGVPLSGRWEPRKRDIREWGSWVEDAVFASVAGGGLIFETLSELEADLGPDDNKMAWVISDPVVPNNGIYRKIGTSGVGIWERLADLPYSFINGLNAGHGTANAIEIATLVAIPSGDGVGLITVPIVENNTGAASVSFNGADALGIVTAAGNPVRAGDLKAGTIVHGYIVGATFQLLTHFGVQHLLATVTGGTSSAIEAETETAVPTEAGAAIVTLEIAATNDASPVTISFNGEPSLTVTTSAGNDVPIGGLVAGMVVDGYVSGDRFRLRTDYASASIVAMAEAQVAYAEEWANKDEDELVSGAAGGDEIDDYSAKHWARKAEAGAAVALNNWARDVFSGTGSEETYMLSIPPGSKANCFISISGVLQATDTYGLSGASLTLTAPLGTDNIEVRYGSSVEVEVGAPTDGSVTAAKIDADDAAAIRAVLGLVDINDRLRVALAPPGSIIQRVKYSRSTSDTTTSATLTDTGLTGAITPQFATSTIRAVATIPRAQVQRVAGDLLQRSAAFAVRNVTSGGTGPEGWFGRNLVATSTAAAISTDNVTVTMDFPVSSLAALTFALQFKVAIATNLEVNTQAANSTCTLELLEIRA